MATIRLPKNCKRIKHELDIEGSYFQGSIMSDIKYIDDVSERHRRVENFGLGRILIKSFREMEADARNGFGELSQREQKEHIDEMKRKARLTLSLGSLFPYEKRKLVPKIEERVGNMYKPYIKWARKDNFQEQEQKIAEGMQLFYNNVSSNYVQAQA